MYWHKQSQPMSPLHILCNVFGLFQPRLRLCRTTCLLVMGAWQCMGMCADLEILADLFGRAYALPLPWWDMHMACFKKGGHTKALSD